MGENFELRNAKFYPYGKYGANQGLDSNTGDNELTGSIMQIGSASLDIDVAVQYTKESGGQVKVTIIDADSIRLEFPTSSDKLQDKFPINAFVFIDHEDYWFNYQGTVTFVDDNTMELFITSSSGAGRGEGYFGGEVIIRTSNSFGAIEIKYNVTPSDSPTFLNELDGGTQVLYTDKLLIANNVDLVPKTGAVKNWTLGEYHPKIDALSSTNDYQVSTKYPDRKVNQHIKIKGIPYIIPYWRDDMADNYNNKTIPEEYQGDKTLKFVSQIKLWYFGLEQKEPIVFNFDVEGNVGYYGEDANGGDTGIQSSTVSYTNVTNSKPEKSIDVKDINSLDIKLYRNFGAFNLIDIVTVYLGKKQDFKEYNQSSINFASTYLYSGISSRADGITTNDAFGRTEFSNLTSIITDAGQTLNISVIYDTFSTTSSRLSEGDEYVLSVSVYNPFTDELAQILIDDPEYSIFKDEENLISLVKGRGYDPGSNFDNGVANGYSSINSWNEDGIISWFNLRQSPSTFGLIESAKLKLLSSRRGAQNGTNNFDSQDDYVVIQELDIPVNQIATTSDGIQIFDDVSYRPFNLKDANAFKEVRIKSIDNGTYVDHLVNVALKVDWQYWNSLKNVPNVFFNASDSFNGYNQRSSNYSEKPSLAIDSDKFDTKVALFVTCKNRKNIYSTEYVAQLPIVVYDFGEDTHTRNGIAPDDFPDFTGEIITEKLDGTDLNGSIITGEPSKIRAHFTNNGRVSGAQSFYFFIRLEESEQKSYDIWEISNTLPPEDNPPIIPLSGFANLNIYSDGADGWWAECQTDYTKLKTGVGYKLSARIGLDEDGTGSGFGFTTGFTIGFNS